MLLQAWHFRRFLLFYTFDRPEERQYFGNHALGAKRIGRLAFWLAASGWLMVITLVTFGIGCANVVGTATIHVPSFCFNTFMFSVARIGVSYTQIRAISANKETSNSCRCLFLGTVAIIFRRKTQIVPSDDGSSSGNELRESRQDIVSPLSYVSTEASAHNGGPWWGSLSTIIEERETSSVWIGLQNEIESEKQKEAPGQEE